VTAGLVLESVWDYPRPPRLERVPQEIVVRFGGAEIVRTIEAWRVLETSHPPTYYLPPDAFTGCELVRAGGGSLCEWKGRAAYWTIRNETRTAERVAWSYPDPTEPFLPIADYVALYCAATDGCFVGGELVSPQPGGFYGGWVTPNLRGPFKGGPGTAGW
jgi:uncharacterized protein (DUF427 family)